jgi:hypothetical protein
MFRTLVPASAVITALLAGVAEPTASAQATGTAADRLTATVRNVAADTRTLELITGVGHALRIVSMKVDPACNIKVEGASATLRDLKAGQIVHIRYRKADGQNVAQMIETPPAAAEGGGR